MVVCFVVQTFAVLDPRTPLVSAIAPKKCRSRFFNSAESFSPQPHKPRQEVTTWYCFVLSSPITFPKMADEERRTSKRSRFDQTEPEVKRISRFDRLDRRSRSPTSRTSEIQRSRSPLTPKTPFSPGAENRKTPLDPAAAAGKPDYLQWVTVEN